MVLCFDAVLFDLDGTLVATDRFWVSAATTGARRAFDELGIEREAPSAADWMALVGLPLEEGMAQLFPDLEPEAVAVVTERCLEEERGALAAGGAMLLPGVLDALTALREAGVKLGIASNCGGDYLEHMLTRLPLGELVHEGRCLDSPGIGDKADMIQDLLETFGTRSAVFVGDRLSDREAAWSNGVPHVHIANGMAAPGERVGAEATIAEMGELLGVLRARTDSVLDLLGKLGVRAGSRVRSIGVTGPSCAGKTALVGDLERVLRNQGRAVRRVEPDGLPEPGAAAGEELLLCEGLDLLAPARRARLDRVVWAGADEEVCRRRFHGREVRLAGPAAAERFLRERAAVELPPGALEPARADWVFDCGNPLRLFGA